MQNKILGLLLALLAATGCMEFDAPYTSGLNRITVTARYPEGTQARAGAMVLIRGISSGSSYNLLTDASGEASTTLPSGIYRVAISDRDGTDVYNGTADKVIVGHEDLTVEVTMHYSKAGVIVIKELYCGGCSKAPEEGTYQSDQYIIVHNNDLEQHFLDGLCLGTLSPYNSNAANPWTDADGNLPDFLPVIQAVWRIPGTGTSFPLEPGEDAVICLRGAIDHSAQYPLSVNLNKAGYFVCYNPVYFPNPLYHPVPGDQISPERYLEVVVKMGQANAYTLSINSPTLVLFRPEGTSLEDFIAQDGHLVQVPGSTVDRVVTVPPEWVVDAMEVFNGGSSDNHKRLPSSVDAGYVLLSETYKGRTLMRKTDEVISEAFGFEVLQDTNNSTEDFYESETQSLHP